MPVNHSSATPPTTWPSLIGAIAIVFGSLGALGSLMGLVVTFFIDDFIELLPEGMDFGMAKMTESQGTLIALNSVTCIVCLILLAGGIALIKRRPIAARLCVTWSILKILLVVVNTVLSYRISAATMEVVQEQMAGDTTAMQMPQEFMQWTMIFGMAIGVLWGWALPVFMLVWFGRQAVRSEVADWRAHPVNPA